MTLVSENILIEADFLVDRAFDFERKEFVALAALARKGLIKVYITNTANAEIIARIAEKSKLALSNLNLSESGLLMHIPKFRHLVSAFDKTAVTQHFMQAFDRFKAECLVTLISKEQASSLIFPVTAPGSADLAQLMDQIIRQEECFQKQVILADLFIEDKNADIEQFVCHQLYNSGYLIHSTELEVEIVDVHILAATIQSKKILLLGQDRFIYRIEFAVNALFGFKPLQCSQTDAGKSEVVYQSHDLHQAIFIEIQGKDLPAQHFKISADIPDEIEVVFEEGEYIDWSVKRKP